MSGRAQGGSQPHSAEWECVSVSVLVPRLVHDMCITYTMLTEVEFGTHWPRSQAVSTCLRFVALAAFGSNTAVPLLQKIYAAAYHCPPDEYSDLSLHSRYLAANGAIMRTSVLGILDFNGELCVKSSRYLHSNFLA